MVAAVGDDVFGGAMLENFKECAVDAAHVKTVPGPSGVALIAVGSEDKTNSIVVVPGANSLLTPEDVDAARPAFEDAAVVLCQMEVPEPRGIVRRSFLDARRGAATSMGREMRPPRCPPPRRSGRSRPRGPPGACRC